MLVSKTAFRVGFLYEILTSQSYSGFLWCFLFVFRPSDLLSVPYGAFEVGAWQVSFSWRIKS